MSIRDSGTNLSKETKIRHSSFKVNRFLKNTHIQTILPKFYFASPNVNFTTERFTTFDGDFVDLAWSLPQDPKAIVVLFHGLEGSSRSHYIQFLVQALKAQDYGSVVMHFRGCSGEPNIKPISYHSGAIFDPEFLIPTIKKRFTQLPLFAVGFSLGGNMLMNLMAKRPDLEIARSVCISAPLDLAASSEVINQGFSRLYQRHLLKSMKANLLHKMKTVDMSKWLQVKAEQITNLSSFREFDDAVTAPVHGYEDADDYYHNCSAIHFLHKVEKPTLIVHAKDDPFMDDRVMPNDAQLSPSIRYEYSQHGGHVGFVQALNGEHKTWLPFRTIDFLHEHWS